MSGPFDDFLTNCVRDSISGYTRESYTCPECGLRWLDGRVGCVHRVEPGDRVIEPAAETSEPDHTHRCPSCGDFWQHADVDCEAVWPGRTWARCPFHEGRDDD